MECTPAPKKNLGPQIAFSCTLCMPDTMSSPPACLSSSAASTELDWDRVSDCSHVSTGKKWFQELKANKPIFQPRSQYWPFLDPPALPFLLPKGGKKSTSPSLRNGPPTDSSTDLLHQIWRVILSVRVCVESKRTGTDHQ